jgi:hypothetical protein
MNQRLQSDVAQIEFWWKVSKKINPRIKQNTQRKPNYQSEFEEFTTRIKAILNPNPTVDEQKSIAKQVSIDQIGIYISRARNISLRKYFLHFTTYSYN